MNSRRCVANGRTQNRSWSADFGSIHDFLVFRGHEFDGRELDEDNLDRVEGQIPEGLRARNVLLAGRQLNSMESGSDSRSSHLERRDGADLGQRSLLFEIKIDWSENKRYLTRVYLTNGR